MRRHHGRGELTPRVDPADVIKFLHFYRGQDEDRKLLLCPGSGRISMVINFENKGHCSDCGNIVR